MGRTKKNSDPDMDQNIMENKDLSFIDSAIENTPKDELEDMPINSLKEYLAYNKRARALNHKLRMCRYPIKQCPEELHPKQRIVFNRVDQPKNPLPVFLSNEYIHYEKKLIPGKTYDLPHCVVDHLQSKGLPVWKWFDNPDGSKETRISHYEPRFALRSVFSEDEAM